jgi:hypothetical protein
MDARQLQQLKWRSFTAEIAEGHFFEPFAFSAVSHTPVERLQKKGSPVIR